MTKEIQKKSKESSTPICDYIKGINPDFKPRTNCKFCMSPIRTEAEAEYERTNNIRAVEIFLIKNKESISYNAIRNHIIEHYKKYEIQLRLKEWAEDIPAFMQYGKDRTQILEERKAILTQQMIVIASETEGKSLEDRRKSAEAIKKLSDAITTLEDKIDERELKMEPVFIIIEKLQDIISIRMKSNSSEEVKRELMTVLEQLAESTKTLQVPK